MSNVCPFCTDECVFCVRFSTNTFYRGLLECRFGAVKHSCILDSDNIVFVQQRGIFCVWLLFNAAEIPL